MKRIHSLLQGFRQMKNENANGHRFLTRTALLFLALCLGFVSCKDDEEVEPAPQQLPVNYANIAGNWQLVSYNGHSLEADTYLYLVLERRDPHKFQMYDNLQSMYGQQRTGTYLLEEDETETTILSGFYDNGVGAWNDDYTVNSLTEQTLQLTTVAEPREIHCYKRVETVPTW